MTRRRRLRFLAQDAAFALALFVLLAYGARIGIPGPSLPWQYAAVIATGLFATARSVDRLVDRHQPRRRDAGGVR